MFRLGPLEILLVVIVVLMLMRPGELPRLLRRIGSAYRRLRQELVEVTEIAARLVATWREDDDVPEEARQPNPSLNTDSCDQMKARRVETRDN